MRRNLSTLRCLLIAVATISNGTACDKEKPSPPPQIGDVFQQMRSAKMDEHYIKSLDAAYKRVDSGADVALANVEMIPAWWESSPVDEISATLVRRAGTETDLSAVADRDGLTIPASHISVIYQLQTGIELVSVKFRVSDKLPVPSEVMDAEATMERVRNHGPTMPHSAREWSVLVRRTGTVDVLAKADASKMDLIQLWKEP